MEDKSNVIIFAGYKQEMEELMNINPGFKSRIGSTINFDINVRETKNELLLKKNEVTAIIPELNEYAPIDVKVTNNNVEYEYNNETRELKIVRTSTVDEDGKVTNTLPSNNTYKLEVTYPQDAINVIDNYTVITALVSTYYEGYNNNNEQGEFENPSVSNTGVGTIKLIFDRYPASAYNFFVNIQDKKYVSYVNFDFVGKANYSNIDYRKSNISAETIKKWINDNENPIKKTFDSYDKLVGTFNISNSQLNDIYNNSNKYYIVLETLGGVFDSGSGIEYVGTGYDLSCFYGNLASVATHYIKK